MHVKRPMDLRLARDACRSYVINVDSLAGKPLQAYLYTHVLHGARQTIDGVIDSLWPNIGIPHRFSSGNPDN